MRIDEFVIGNLFANTYVISEGEDAFLVDCGGDPTGVIEFIEKHELKLKYILITHGHGDHIYGLDKIRQATGAKIGIHKNDVVALTHAFNLSISGAEPVKEDFHFKEKDKLEVGPMVVKVLETPGHSPGGVCFYLKEQKVMFTGDTLFNHGVGRDDFPGGSWGKLKKSLHRLISMDLEIKIYPGHGQSSTIGAEKKFLSKSGII